MAHTAYEGSNRTRNEHLPNWVTLCNPMGGHTEKLTNLTPHPQLSFCVWHSTWGCVGKKIHSYSKLISGRVHKASVLWRPSQWAELTVTQASAVKADPVCKVQGKKKKKTDTDVLISAIIHKILTQLTGWCKVQMIIPHQKTLNLKYSWWFFWISSFFVLPHPCFQNCSNNWGFGENSKLLKLCHPK